MAVHVQKGKACHTHTSYIHNVGIQWCCCKGKATSTKGKEGHKKANNTRKKYKYNTSHIKVGRPAYKGRTKRR